MPMGAPFGTRLFGQMLRFLGAEAPTIPSFPIRRYRLEVHDREGNCLAEIARWLSGEVKHQINQPASLSLEVENTETSVPYLKRPNLIWLFDVDDSHIETFVIWASKENDETLELEGLSLESNLAREAIPEHYRVQYSEGNTIQQIVTDLLAYQQLEPPVYKGVLDDAVKNKIYALDVDAGTSILTALHQLQEGIGGYLWVDAKGALQWKMLRGRNIGQEVIEGHNLAHLDISYGYSELVTKLYYYGQAEGDDAHLNLTHAGEAQEYLLAPQDIIDEHGIITQVVQDTDISDPQILLERAQAYLAAHQTPQPSLDGDVIDLSHDPAYGYDIFKGVYLGDSIKIYSDRLPDGMLKLEVLSVARDLNHPQLIKVTWGRIIDDLTTLFAGMQQEIEAPPDLPDPAPYARIMGEIDLPNHPGIRHGSIVFDDLTDEFYGVLLNPDDIRLPDPLAEIELIPLGGFSEEQLQELIPEPGNNIQPVGESCEPGTSENYAREDHVHEGMEPVDVPQPGSDIQSVGSQNQAGISETYARSDHVHAGGTGGGSTEARWIPWDGGYC